MEKMATNSIEVVEDDSSVETVGLAEEFLKEQGTAGAASDVAGAGQEVVPETTVSLIIKVVATIGAIVLAFLCLGAN